MYHNQTKAEDRKTAGVPRMSEVSSGVLLMGQQAVYRDESGPVLLYYVRTSFARLGFSLLAKVLYLLIFQVLVSSCVKATGE